MKARGLAYTYPGRGSFSIGPLDFEGPEGRLWLLLGPSGAGKTTLLRLLAGDLKPGAGRLVGGRPLRERAYLPQMPERALAGRNLAEDFGEGVRPSGDRRKRLRRILSRVGLAGVSLSRSSRSLSYGERRCLLLGLLTHFEYRDWYLDEPDAGLDAAGYGRLRGLLDRHLAGGGQLRVAGHRPGLYARFDPYTLVLGQGRLVAAGRLRELMASEALQDALGQTARAGGRLWSALGRDFPDLPPNVWKTLSDSPSPIPQVQEILRDTAASS